MQDYYQTLGVSENASEAEIKKAFRRLAKKFHPDRNSGAEAEARFKSVNEAYSVVGDPKKRAQYDARLRGVPPGFEGFGQNHDDIWSEFFGGFGDIFGRRQPRREKRNPRDSWRDKIIQFEIPLRDIVDSSAEHIFQDATEEECKSCNGAGGSNPEMCSRCGGSGQLSFTQQIGSIRIQNTGACPDCKGRGVKFSNVCQPCNGSGKTRTVKKFKIKITAREI